jgi:hypothetical protein
MNSPSISALGPRQSGRRKNKGRRKPVATRQARARRQALLRQLAQAGAAVALSAGAAQAYPQWVYVSQDRAWSMDYNSVADHGGGMKSVTVGKLGSNAFRASVHCPSWRFSGDGGPWVAISKDSVAETVAYAICPGPMRAQMLRILKGGDPGPRPMPPVEPPQGWPASRGEAQI